MANNLQVFGGFNSVRMKDNTERVDALRQTIADDPRGSMEGVLYANFSGKRGVYEIGPDKDDVDDQDYWLVNSYGVFSGWKCWKGGTVIEDRMANIYERSVPTPDMSEHGPFAPNKSEGWHLAKGVILRNLHSGTIINFSTNSKSGVNSITKLCQAIADQMEAGEPEFPIVRLKREKFTAQGNTNYKPVFDIMGWFGPEEVEYSGRKEILSGDDVEAMLDGEVPEDYDEPEVLDLDPVEGEEVEYEEVEEVGDEDEEPVTVAPTPRTVPKPTTPRTAPPRNAPAKQEPKKILRRQREARK